MKVLFLMIAYPDVNQSGNMYTDLTDEFLVHGHEVYVIAPGNQMQYHSERGINVLRIKTMALFNTSFIRKGIANLLLPYKYNKGISKYFEKIKFDLVITATPPITFFQTIAFLKRRFNTKIYLILRDIFPQNARDIGLIKNKYLFNYFRKQEKQLYNISDFIGCMSQKNIDYVCENNAHVDPGKFHMLPNWMSVRQLNLSNLDFRSKNGLENKFVAVFGGNLGVPQKLDFLIEVADMIKENDEIIFLIVGDGTEKARIKNMIHNKNLSNVLLYDQMPRQEYLEMLRTVDLGLVCLSEKFTIPNIPSRTLSYWSHKIPVLAATDKNTDFKDIINNCEGGLWSEMGDMDSYISNLFFFYNHPEKRKYMGEKGYSYLVTELNTENAYKTIISRLT